METNKIYQGNSLGVLKTFPDESIDMVMTSPPYWALRDYNVDGQLGLEPTFKEYIKNLCNIFDEVKRVLKKEGTCWVNLGDTYSGSGKGTGYEGDKKESRNFDKKPKTTQQLPDKCLCLIPERFAIEMVNRGWILRNQIIWKKPNCMPSSAKDRFTVDFELVFFFVKNKKYWFEQQRSPHKSVSLKRIKSKWNGHREKMSAYEGMDISKMCHPEGKNMRTTWNINTKGYSEAHFAVYPEELCKIPIKAGCPKGGIVLDPFFGAGTTGLVALKNNRKFIGIELNPEYIKIANKRIGNLKDQTNLSNY